MAWARVLMAVAIWFVGLGAQAQDEIAGFDGHDRKIVQAALALAGTYDGLIDGDFGPRSRRAFDVFMARGGGDRAAHFAHLLQELGREWRAFGWGPAKTPRGAVHLVMPSAPVAGGGLDVTLTTGSRAAAQAQHAAIAAANLGDAPYVLRRDRLWVTASEISGGGRIYVRSDRTGSGYDTLLISADAENRGRLQLIASSVTRAGPPDLDPFAAPQVASMLGALTRDMIDAVRVAPGVALIAGSGCGAFVDGQGALLPVLRRNAVLDVVALAVPDTSGIVSLGGGQSLGLEEPVNLGEVLGKVVATSSALLSIGSAEVLAASEARPGEEVIESRQDVPVGRPVRTAEGLLAGLVLRNVETGAGRLVITAGPPVLAALVPSGRATMSRDGDPAVPVACR